VTLNQIRYNEELIITNSMKQGPCYKVMIVQVAKKFPAQYGTPRFILVFTRTRHDLSTEPDGPGHALMSSFIFILILSFLLRVGEA